MNEVHPIFQPILEAACPPAVPLYTVRKYPCGCSAEGPGDVPAYCSEHGKPESREPFYRVAPTGDEGDCVHCGQSCPMWTIVYVMADGQEAEVGQSWGHKQTAEDICELMNAAYIEGSEIPV